MLAAAPAWGQGLTATLTGPTKPVAYGSTAKYKLTITNGPGAIAKGVTVTAAIPAEITNDAKHVSVDATCAPVDPNQTGAFPCTVADIAADGGKATVTISLALDVPDPLPADCATAQAPIGPVTATVTSTGNPPVTTAATAPVARAPFANLSADLTGPATATVGQTITYTSTVKNLGPCPSTAVEASVAGNTLLDNGFVSNAGDCTTAFPCKFAVIAPGQTVTFTSTFKVTGLASGTMSEGTIALPETLTAASTDVTNDAGDVVQDAVPDLGDNQGTASATTKVPIASSGTGCASAGGLGMLAGLGLFLALAARRRRVQA